MGLWRIDTEHYSFINDRIKLSRKSAITKSIVSNPHTEVTMPRENTSSDLHICMCFALENASLLSGNTSWFNERNNFNIKLGYIKDTT